MDKLLKVGRALYSLGIVAIGVHQLITQSFRPDVLPPFPMWLQHPVFAIIVGVVLITAGLLISGIRIASINAKEVSLYLAFFFLFVIVTCHLPYLVFIIPDKISQLQYWFGVGETLAYAGGALVVAGSFETELKSNRILLSMQRLVPYGIIFFSILMFIFGCSHFVYAAAVSTMVPKYFGVPMFWTYLVGVLLIGAAIALTFSIWSRMVSLLLAIMLFLFFIFFHIPDAVANPTVGGGNEIVRAIIALLFCGIALVHAANYLSPVTSDR